MQKVIFFVIACMLSVSLSRAEGIETDDKSATITIEGFVLDKNTGEPLEGTKVTTDGAEGAVYADENGFFHIETKRSAKYDIELQYISYEKLKMNVEEPNQIIVCNMKEVD